MEGCFRQVSPWLLEQLISEQSLVEPFLLVGFRSVVEQSPSQVGAALKNDAFLMEMAQDMELQIRGLVAEYADTQLGATGEFDSEANHFGQQFEISFDIVNPEDADTIEGCYRVTGRFWEVFVFVRSDVAAFGIVW